MYEGEVESVHYPRNPLDVLAQQIVAMVAMDPWDATDLLQRGAPRRPVCCTDAAHLRGRARHAVRPLSHRKSSRSLRPRITWDRVTHKITTREGSQRVAVINGGTIPDRGLYGVFLADAVKGARVGELDEEMVFESRPGDTIALGATTWRIEEILHDRVIVSPAPGEPGKMPFWHGDAAGRPAEFGATIGEMSRELLRLPRPVAFTKLSNEHSLDANAAENLLRYLEDQARATTAIPSDEAHRHRNLPRRNGRPPRLRAHSFWHRACMRRGAWPSRRSCAMNLVWKSNRCGPTTASCCVCRRMKRRSNPTMLLPSPAEMKDLVLRQLGSTSMFAAKFREAASRALLLPRRRAGHARAAVATAQARGRFAGGGVAVFVVSDSCSKRIASAFATSSICRR